jgi:ubiquinone/menaquinone biosynthesis C-methylase UbiE
MTFNEWKNMKGKEVPSTSEYSEKLLDYLLPNKVVLDIGCGYGRLSLIIKEKGCRVYGIDINKNAIKEAKNNPNLESVKFSVQDAKRTNFSNNFFDVVVSQAVLACMDKKERRKVLKEVYRILKPEGILSISEFGMKSADKLRYEKDALITKEYGTVIVGSNRNAQKFRTHNFNKAELKLLLKETRFKIIHYENPGFVTIHDNQHPGHIFICQK